MMKSFGSIKDYTPNYKFIIPEFDIATWHDYIEKNFRNIDALFYNLFGINNYSGEWTQLTEYKQGQVLFIGKDVKNEEETEYSGRLVKVLQDHTTDNSEYFNIYFELHPDYYELFADASTAQNYAQQAQQSAENALESETNAKESETNSKNSENIATQKANDAATSATNATQSAQNAQNYENSALESKNAAKISEDNAKISENNAKESEDNAKISEINAKTSENKAKANEQVTLSYKNDATSSATVATEQALEARNQANNASMYAKDSLAHANDADTFANFAKQSLDNARISETNAAESAKQAADSATDAANIAASIDPSTLAKTDLSNLTEGLFYGNLTGNNRVKFSNGLVLQWGAGTIKAGTKDLLITLPIEYTKYFRAFVISNSTSVSTASIYSTANNGLTGFYAHRSESPSGNGATFSWFTIGI